MMKYTLSPSLVRIASIAAKIPGVKALLKPFYYAYKQSLKKKRNQEFLKNGQKVLSEFDAIMNENNYHYSIYAGTLLGAIREKSFLKHDLDIDTALFYDEYSPNLHMVLEQGGFKLLHRFTADGGTKGMEETYLKNDITIDIFYVYYDDDGNTYQCDFHPIKGCTWERSMSKYGYLLVRRNDFTVSRGIKRVQIDGIEVNAIDNAEQWLAQRYGDDYMIPNPNFHDRGDNPRMNMWDEVKGHYTSY